MKYRTERRTVVAALIVLVPLALCIVGMVIGGLATW